MSSFMEYKGYYSNPRYSAEDDTFWGKLEGIEDIISFEGTTVDCLRTSFIEAVEDYLDTCKRNGLNPKIPFKGHFEIDIPPEIHKKVVLYASENDMSLNQVVEIALKGYFTYTDN